MKKDELEKKVKAGANLGGVDLRGASLSCAKPASGLGLVG